MSLLLPCTEGSFMCYFSLYKRYFLLDETINLNIKLRGNMSSGLRNLRETWENIWNLGYDTRLLTAPLQSLVIMVCIWWKKNCSGLVRNQIYFNFGVWIQNNLFLRKKVFKKEHFLSDVLSRLPCLVFIIKRTTILFLLVGGHWVYHKSHSALVTKTNPRRFHICLV